MNAAGRQTGREIADAGPGRRRQGGRQWSGGCAEQPAQGVAHRWSGRLPRGAHPDRVDRSADHLERSPFGAVGSSGGAEASQQGALAELADQPFGAVLLWITAVGLFALAISQVVEAMWGHRDRPAGFKRIRKQLGSGGLSPTPRSG